MNTSSRHISNEQELQNDLQNGNRRGDGDEEILIVFVGIQSAGDKAEHRVDEETESWDAQ